MSRLITGSALNIKRRDSVERCGTIDRVDPKGSGLVGVGSTHFAIPDGVRLIPSHYFHAEPALGASATTRAQQN